MPRKLALRNPEGKHRGEKYASKKKICHFSENNAKNLANDEISSISCPRVRFLYK